MTEETAGTAEKENEETAGTAEKENEETAGTAEKEKGRDSGHQREKHQKMIRKQRNRRLAPNYIYLTGD